MKVASLETQALPVLMASRSVSPFLKEGQSRGRSPYVKRLPHVGSAPGQLQLLPTSGGDAELIVTLPRLPTSGGESLHVEQTLAPPVLPTSGGDAKRTVTTMPCSNAGGHDVEPLAFSGGDGRAPDQKGEVDSVGQISGSREVANESGLADSVSKPLLASTSTLKHASVGSWVCDIVARARKVKSWEALLLTCVFVFSGLHAPLEKSSKEYVHDNALFEYMALRIGFS